MMKLMKHDWLIPFLFGIIGIFAVLFVGAAEHWHRGVVGTIDLGIVGLGALLHEAMHEYNVDREKRSRSMGGGKL